MEVRPGSGFWLKALICPATGMDMGERLLEIRRNRPHAWRLPDYYRRLLAHSVLLSGAAFVGCKCPLELAWARGSACRRDARWRKAARRILQLAAGFSYLPDRWHVLIADGQPAGFVLPVTFDGWLARGPRRSDDLPHGRRSGPTVELVSGACLLRRATRVLIDHGVWRIFCGTPANNFQ